MSGAWIATCGSACVWGSCRWEDRIGQCSPLGVAPLVGWGRGRNPFKLCQGDNGQYLFAPFSTVFLDVLRRDHGFMSVQPPERRSRLKRGSIDVGGGIARGSVAPLEIVVTLVRGSMISQTNNKTIPGPCDEQLSSMFPCRGKFRRTKCVGLFSPIPLGFWYLTAWAA